MIKTEPIWILESVEDGMPMIITEPSLGAQRSQVSCLKAQRSKKTTTPAPPDPGEENVRAHFQGFGFDAGVILPCCAPRPVPYACKP